MVERNVEVPPENRIEFRIGINLGDVIAEADDIFGDGVNILVRLEALAEPGGNLCQPGSPIVWRSCLGAHPPEQAFRLHDEPWS
jgi:hypothetical protein